jgi:predicted amidophosphoribosyltransferase
MTYSTLVRRRRCTRCRRRTARPHRTKCSACAAALRRTDRAGWLRRQYKLTTESLRRMLRSQGGRCYVCHRRLRLADAHVDHEHRRNRVRAAICRACNLAEGILRHMRSFSQLNRWIHGLLALRTVARW